MELITWAVFFSGPREEKYGKNESADLLVYSKLTWVVAYGYNPVYVHTFILFNLGSGSDADLLIFLLVPLNIKLPF